MPDVSASAGPMCTAWDERDQLPEVARGLKFLLPVPPALSLSKETSSTRMVCVLDHLSS